MTDELKIIRECLEGNTDRYGILVERYQDALIRTAYRFLWSWEDAKDAAQEAFVKAFLALKRFDQTRRFSTWLQRILVNECLDRKKAAYRRLRNPWAPHLEQADQVDPATEIGEKDLLRMALERLSPRRRRVFILVGLEGFSGSDAAAILGCSESTVRVTMMKARRRLREIYLELRQSEED